MAGWAHRPPPPRHTSELFFKLLRSDFDWEELAVPAVEGQADFFMLLAHRRPPQ